MTRITEVWNHEGAASGTIAGATGLAAAVARDAGGLAVAVATMAVATMERRNVCMDLLGASPRTGKWLPRTGDVVER
jgi:hypothetical protein